MFGPSKKSGIKGLRVIYDQLESAVREKKGSTALVPKKYALYTAEDLYNQFLKVVPDAKGLISSSYGASGWAISFDFYMDFVNFAIPGVFAVPIGASIKPQRMDTAMLIIHRVSPTKIPPPSPPANGTENNPGTNPPEAPRQPRLRPEWVSLRPVCFNAFLGRYWQFEVKAGVQTFFALAPDDAWSGKKDVEKAPKDDPDKSLKNLAFCELPLGLGGSISLDVKYQYQTLYIADPAPGWYPSGSDENLKRDFKQVLGEKSKGRLKLEIARWIGRFSAVFYIYVQYDIRPGTAAIREQLKNTYLEIVKNTIDKSKDAVNKSTPWRKKAGKLFMSFFSSFFDQAAYLMNRIEQKNIATADLIKSLQRLVTLLPTPEEIDNFAPFQTPTVNHTQQQINEEKAQMKDGVSELRMQAAEYIRRLQEIKENPDRNKIPQKGNSKVLPDYCKYLSFLKVGSHAAGPTLGVNAIGGPGTASITADASIKGSAFRYQTFYNNTKDKVLVYTQDTRITYRQVELKIDASLGLLADPNIYEKKPKWLNGMTYTSACCYWLYPETNNETTVISQLGSGISFGASIYVKELNACANDINQNAGVAIKFKSMVETLAGDLRIPIAVLNKFLNNEFFRTLTKADLGGINAVLIESSFRPADNFKVGLLKRSNDKKKLDEPVLGLKEILGSVSYVNQIAELTVGNQDAKDAACTKYLDGLRVRVRMADNDQSEVSFKIGPHAVLSGSGGSSGITLSKITEVGQEGILDIYTVRFGRGYVADPITATPTGMSDNSKTKRVGEEGPQLPDIANYLEDSVPPVALLHQ